MEILSSREGKTFKEKLLYVSCLCLVGVAIDFCGLNIADMFELPLYLDTIGTVIAAYMGGYIPGILVGMFGSLVCNFSDPISWSYGVLNVLMAVLTVYLRDRGVFKSLWKSFLSVFVYAFLGGFLGTVITWSLYGIQYEGVSYGLVELIYNKGVFGVVATHVIADYAIDIADKIIDVVFIVIIDRLTGDFHKELFEICNWQQAPLSDEAVKKLNKRTDNHKSLRNRINMMIAFAAILTAASAILISFFLYSISILDQHEKYARNIANSAALVIDGDMVDTFIESGENETKYEDTKKLLARIVYNTDDLEYLYIYKYDEKDGWHVVFDIDNNGVKAGEPGEIVPIESALLPYEDRLKMGEDIDCYITNDEYGWLMTAMVPIKNSAGEVVAYSCADIDMRPIKSYGRNFFVSQITLFFGVFIFIFAVGLTFAEYHIILPLNSMAYTASELAQNSEDAIEKTAKNLKELDIHTGDEIENLYHAFYSMTESNLNFVQDISNKNETINKMQNALIRVLADMVESRDHNTGDHVMKTAEYAKIIMDEMKKEGIYKDQLTDDFIENVYLSTPLHDIGKISISDTILNKPGKLTDDEFVTMKTHSKAGADIIERVIATVPGADAEYLKEARNLALYHHEKWAGGGYPTGISGEDIPLSARIMAVADVFDALVSERSYKKAFPFEKAIEIIRESSGTHFDPKVAGAFLNAEDKIREVAEATKK